MPLIFYVGTPFPCIPSPFSCVAARSHSIPCVHAPLLLLLILLESCKILVHSLVTSRLDYANILLCNAPDSVTARLESTKVRCETDL